MGKYAGVELDDLELDGARLRLRPWRSTDAPRLVDALNGLAAPPLARCDCSSAGRSTPAIWPGWNSDGTFSDEVRYALINPKYA